MWLVQEVIEVNCLVRAMETANTDMQNALLETTAIVGWHLNAGRDKPQIGLIQSDRAAA